MSDQPKKLDAKSMSTVDAGVQKLKAAFPDVFSEGKIDFDQLKRVLGERVAAKSERFGLYWHGKAECMEAIQAQSHATLKPCRSQSVDWDKTDNLFIEGENMEVLKLLQKSYFAKVKMIYIDPPYNTGKEFVYPDKYADSINTYLRYTGQKDSNGDKFTTNMDTSGRFHSRWLNMMYPRLYLARNLLREDGVIFISIDDNEVSNLRKVCDEIFGEDNFVACVIWHKKYAPANDAKGIPADHDYVLIYQKSELFERGLLPRTEEQDSRYKYDDGDGMGSWKPGDLSVKTMSQSYVFEIINPLTGKSYLPPEGRCWVTSKDTVEKWIREKRVFFGKAGKGKPQLKRYLSEVMQGRVPTTYWSYDDVGHTDGARKELKALFARPPFDNPKPTRLIERMAIIAGKEDKDFIVLDFFAGSATTAHALMKLNSSDGGKRKYICVQLPEPCPPDSEAAKSGFNNIADIAKKRIRLAAEKITSSDDLDLGFRAFKLDKSCFKPWDDSPNNSAQTLLKMIEEQADYLDSSASKEDILYEILLTAGFSLTTPVETLRVLNKDIYSVNGGKLLICLEQGISEELMLKLAEMRPNRVVCLDACFQGDDVLKANSVNIFRNHQSYIGSTIDFCTI